MTRALIDTRLTDLRTQLAAQIAERDKQIASLQQITAALHQMQGAIVVLEQLAAELEPPSEEPMA